MSDLQGLKFVLLFLWPHSGGSGVSVLQPTGIIVESDEGIVHPCLPGVIMAEYAGVIVGVSWCL